MKHEIETVLAGARAERLANVDLTRDRLQGLLLESTTHVEAGVAARGRLAAAMRNMAILVEEGVPPFDGALVQEVSYAVVSRIKTALEGVPTKAEAARLDRLIKAGRVELDAAAQCDSTPLESYLQAALAAGETHISTNALKDAGISPRETMDLVAQGQRERYSSNA